MARHSPSQTGPQEEGVTDVADDDAGFVVDLLIQCRADGDIARAAHDGVVRIDAKGREEGVHRAAHAFVESRLPAEDLGQGPVDQISLSARSLTVPWASFSTMRRHCAVRSRSP